MKYTVTDKNLWLDGELFLEDSIAVDANQGVAQYARNYGVPYIVKRIPTSDRHYADYAFASESGHSVGVEAKRLRDLVGSYNGRRLQGQLRDLRKAFDISILGIQIEPLRHRYDRLHENLWTDLLKWSAIGGICTLLPDYDEDVLTVLRSWRSVLQPTKALYSVVSGEEKKRVEGTPCEKGLQKLFRGVGPKMSKRIATYFNQSLYMALYAPPHILRKAGCTSRVIEQIMEVK